MKKMISILLFLGLLVALPGAAFSAITVGADSITVGTSTFTTSTKVVMNVSTNDTMYTATSAHTGGMFGFATTQDRSVIKSDNKLTVTNGVIAATASGTAGDLPSGYTE